MVRKSKYTPLIFLSLLSLIVLLNTSPNGQGVGGGFKNTSLFSPMKILFQAIKTKDNIKSNNRGLHSF